MKCCVRGVWGWLIRLLIWVKFILCRLVGIVGDSCRVFSGNGVSMLLLFFGMVISIGLVL